MVDVTPLIVITEYKKPTLVAIINDLVAAESFDAQVELMKQVNDTLVALSLSGLSIENLVEQPILNDLVHLVLDLRFGWSENEGALADKVTTVKASTPSADSLDVATKQRVNKAADALIKYLSRTALTTSMVISLEEIMTVSPKPVVRKQTVEHFYSWLKSNLKSADSPAGSKEKRRSLRRSIVASLAEASPVGAMSPISPVSAFTPTHNPGHDRRLVDSTSFASESLSGIDLPILTRVIVRTLTDVWSAIRKDSMRNLYAIVDRFPLDTVAGLFVELCSVVQAEGSDWKRIEGAFMGTHSVIKRFRREDETEKLDTAGGSSARGDSLNSSMPVVLWGSDRLTGLPAFVTRDIKRLFYLGLANDQLSVRDITNRSFTAYLDRSPISELHATLEEALGKLGSDRTVSSVGDFEAEALLSLTQNLVKSLEPSYLLSNWTRLWEVCSACFGHSASTVRQAASLLFVEIVGAIDTEPKSVCKVIRLSLHSLTTAWDHRVASPEADRAVLSNSWRWKEGALLSLELLLNHILSNYKRHLGPLGSVIIHGEATAATASKVMRKSISVYSQAKPARQHDLALVGLSTLPLRHRRLQAKPSSGAAVAAPLPVVSEVILSAGGEHTHAPTETCEACRLRKSVVETTAYGAFRLKLAKLDKKVEVLPSPPARPEVPISMDEISTVSTVIGAIRQGTIEPLAHSADTLLDFTNIFQKLLHQVQECIGSSAEFELRRMVAQVIPVLSETLVFIDMSILANYWRGLATQIIEGCNDACQAIVDTVRATTESIHLCQTKCMDVSSDGRRLSSRAASEAVSPSDLDLLQSVVADFVSVIPHLLEDLYKLATSYLSDKLTVSSVESIVMIYAYFGSATTGDFDLVLNIHVERRLLHIHAVAAILSRVYQKVSGTGIAGSAASDISAEEAEAAALEAVKRQRASEVMDLKFRDGLHQLLPRLVAKVPSYQALKFTPVMLRWIEVSSEAEVQMSLLSGLRIILMPIIETAKQHQRSCSMTSAEKLGDVASDEGSVSTSDAASPLALSDGPDSPSNMFATTPHSVESDGRLIRVRSIDEMADVGTLDTYCYDMVMKLSGLLRRADVKGPLLALVISTLASLYEVLLDLRYISTVLEAIAMRVEPLAPRGKRLTEEMRLASSGLAGSSVTEDEDSVFAAMMDFDSLLLRSNDIQRATLSAAMSDLGTHAAGDTDEEEEKCKDEADDDGDWDNWDDDKTESDGATMLEEFSKFLFGLNSSFKKSAVSAVASPIAVSRGSSFGPTSPRRIARSWSMAQGALASSPRPLTSPKIAEEAMSSGKEYDLEPLTLLTLWNKRDRVTSFEGVLRSTPDVTKFVIMWAMQQNSAFVLGRAGIPPGSPAGLPMGPLLLKSVKSQPPLPTSFLKPKRESLP